MPDADAAWARASVLNAVGGTVYEVRIDGIDDNDEAGQSDWGAGDIRRVDLAGVRPTVCAWFFGCAAAGATAVRAPNESEWSYPPPRHGSIVVLWCNKSCPWDTQRRHSSVACGACAPLRVFDCVPALVFPSGGKFSNSPLGTTAPGLGHASGHPPCSRF